MIPSLFDTSTIPLLEQVAAFTERRQEVLAGNIANISTPDYRMRDLPLAEFQQALRTAVERQQPSRAGAAAEPAAASGWMFRGWEQPGTLEELFPRQLLQARESSHPAVSFQDGNNRSIEREMMELTKNSMMQTLAVELLSAQFNRLQAAISERP